MDVFNSTLLIVDDEPANIFMLDGILSAVGYTVDTASNGVEAVALLKNKEYDAVLLDIMMPQMTGLDVLVVAKELGIIAETPFIMVSAKVESTDVENAMDLGAVEYIRKPVDEIELLARLRTVLKIKKQDVELKKLNKELHLKNKIITESIESAKKIQHAMLPTHTDIETYLPKSFIFFKPKDVVSGDFYWFTHYEGKTLVVEGDCTGHGVSGAFLSMIGSSLLDKIVLKDRIFSPAKIIEELSSDFIHSLNKHVDSEEDKLFDGMEISIACIDTNTKQVTMASAGQDILYIDASHTIQRIQGGLFSIGYEMEAMNGGKLIFDEHCLSLDEITSLFLFSDGYVDQFGGENDEKFMLQRFEDIFEKHNSEIFHNPQAILEETLSDWQGNKNQTDDIIIIGINLESFH